jgi:hypothetical protein
LLAFDHLSLSPRLICQNVAELQRECNAAQHELSLAQRQVESLTLEVQQLKSVNTTASADAELVHAKVKGTRVLTDSVCSEGAHAALSVAPFSPFIVNARCASSPLSWN